jgi:phosphoheptose isomerase
MVEAISYHTRLIEVLESNKNEIARGIKTLTELIIETSRRNKNTWLIGNGGSASTVEHFETDLTFIRQENLVQYPVVSSLTANSALITAASNDLAFENVFKVLLERKGKPGDLLLLFSASGNSKNILKAIEGAHQIGIQTFSILGFNGGQAESSSDQSLVIRTHLGEFGIVEDIHLSICHAVSSELRTSLMVEK